MEKISVRIADISLHWKTVHEYDTDGRTPHFQCRWLVYLPDPDNAAVGQNKHDTVMHKHGAQKQKMGYNRDGRLTGAIPYYTLQRIHNQHFSILIDVAN